MPEKRILSLDEGRKVIAAVQRARADMRSAELKVDALNDRARDLRRHAGNARFRATRWVFMALAHRLEEQARKVTRRIIAVRKVLRAADGVEGGHRAARRQMHRDA